VLARSGILLYESRTLDVRKRKLAIAGRDKSIGELGCIYAQNQNVDVFTNQAKKLISHPATRHQEAPWPSIAKPRLTDRQAKCPEDLALPVKQ
jgi:hypothetical protein